jgi:diguanylate cyclase (GGDEF)-like protein
MASTARIQEIRRREDPTSRDANGPEHHEGDAILRHLNDFLNAFMWQADPATLEITFVTTSVRDLLGHPVQRWLGGPVEWSANIHPGDRYRVVDCLHATAADGADREVEFRADHADGRKLVLRLAVRLVSGPSGESELWGITSDITGGTRVAETLRATQERYRALSAKAKEFRRRALEDPLTKLPNRVLFDDRLGAALRNAQRTGATLAVLVMDLDRFKQINDTHGHQAGDAVLREVAVRLRICLRAQDTPARLGGDEFAALLPTVDLEGARRVAARFVRAMETPFEFNGSRCAIGVSIGIAMFPESGDSCEGLLADADVAMYQAKRAGGGRALAAHEVETHPRRTRRRNRRRILGRLVIGLAAAFAILAGALSPMAHPRPTRQDSASRLEAATVALQSASDDEVVDGVAAAERTLAEIAWKDVAGLEVVHALRRLQRMLAGLSGMAPALVERVDRLLETIRRAEIVATLSSTPKPASISSLVPKVEQSPPVKPHVVASPGMPEPRPVPTILAPKL